MPVVSFIVAGFMKSGTTTLNDYLLLNDKITMCTPKEPQFFSRDYDEGIEYYESLWQSDTKVCGEASTCYSRWPFYKDVPKRIAAYNPKMKLIFIMRHPVERAYSHYKHNVMIDGCSYRSFSEALEFSDEILMTSKYMKQVSQFLEYFPKEQVLLVDFDELIHHGEEVINRVNDFIGVEGIIKHAQDNTIVSNSAGVVASKNYIINIINKIRNNIIVSFIFNKVVKLENRKKIRKNIEKSLRDSFLLAICNSIKLNKFKQLLPDERTNLLAKLREDTEELEIFWNKDLSKWKV